jgi:alpha-ketoglutarate-dependent taurine dioxygenase
MESLLVEEPLTRAQSVQQSQALLAEQGWAVLDPALLGPGARPILQNFGCLMPQYNGQETFEVMVKPGFEGVPYSQSRNGIGPHTEVPVADPPPRYLALHCHRQARCGHGHTMLADGLQFCEGLGELERYATDESIEFSATVEPGSRTRQVLQAPMLSAYGDARVFRFSYNLFRFGDINPSDDDVVKSAGPLNANATLARLAQLGEDYFRANCARVLIPDGAMLIWDNHRLMHARSQFSDTARHLTRYWLR